MKRTYLTFIKSGIKIFYTEQDKIFLNETYFGIMKGIKILTSYFGLNKKLPVIKAIIAENRIAYNSILQHIFKLKLIKTPPSRIAQTKGCYLLLLSPRVYSYDSIYTYQHDEYLRLLVHEIAHIIIRRTSGGEDNVPRWFEEGLAVYLSKQWLYEDEFRKQLFQRILINKIPSFKKIIQDRRYYYCWGWTIIKYIEKMYGKKIILKIIEKSIQQDIFEILGEKKHLLEQKWKDHLRNNIAEYIFTELGKDRRFF